MSKLDDIERQIRDGEEYALSQTPKTNDSWKDWTIIGILVSLLVFIGFLFGQQHLLELFNQVKGN